MGIGIYRSEALVALLPLHSEEFKALETPSSVAWQVTFPKATQGTTSSMGPPPPQQPSPRHPSMKKEGTTEQGTGTIITPFDTGLAAGGSFAQSSPRQLSDQPWSCAFCHKRNNPTGSVLKRCIQCKKKCSHAFNSRR